MWTACPGTVPKTAITNQPAQEHIAERAIVTPKPNIAKEDFMGSTADKIKGTTNEAVGKAKQGIGEAVGSERLQGEGAIQEAKGHGQKAVGDAKQAAKDVANKAAAAANKKL
jgi:uncharacterized protein YjbJ (UPF0337 family)